jgi:DNA-binding XRE family transcriptional regulator
VRQDWLWDRKLGAAEAGRILKNPGHKQFITLASLLLARKNEPREIFNLYLDPRIFCRYWGAIKRRMRQDKWAEPRIIFWQAIYEKLIEKYRDKGIIFKKEPPPPRPPVCRAVGEQIRAIRKEMNISQRGLAAKMGVSQQLVSRIEKGMENISLITLKNVGDAMAKKVVITFISTH